MGDEGKALFPSWLFLPLRHVVCARQGILTLHFSIPHTATGAQHYRSNLHTPNSDQRWSPRSGRLPNLADRWTTRQIVAIGPAITGMASKICPMKGLKI